MAGKIVADQLEHSTAGSLDTQFVVKGSAKHWGYFNASSGTPTLIDSLNISSLGDVNVGRYTIAISSAFSDVNYNIVPSSNAYNTDGFRINQSINAKQNFAGTVTATNYDFVSYADNNYRDAKYNYVLGHGDLA